MRNATQRRVDRLVVGEGIALGDGPRRPAKAAQQRAELVSMIALRSGPRGSGACAPGRRGSAGASNAARTWSSKKWANGPCPTSWSRPGHPQRLGDQTLRRDRLVTGRDKGRAQARVERPRPESGFVHDAKAVGEPGVLGGREDPASALQLADPAQPLQPGRVEEVLLGDILGGQPGGRRLGRPSAAWSARCTRGSGR